MTRMSKKAKKEQAARLIQSYMAQGCEHGPVYYEEFGKMMGTMPFGEVQAIFDNRYPILADERIFEAYGDVYGNAD